MDDLDLVSFPTETMGFAARIIGLTDSRLDDSSLVVHMVIERTSTGLEGQGFFVNLKLRELES